MVYTPLKYQKTGELVDMAEKLKRQRKTAASNGSDRMNISATLRMPLYHQIFLILRQKILGSDCIYGDLIPSEFDLVDEYSVSRITARRALDELAKEKLVKRERGKGTTVQFRHPTQPLEPSVAGAKQTISAALADADVVALLETEVGVALLEIQRIAIDSECRPVEYIRGLYQPDRYQYNMVLSRIQGEGLNTWSS